MNILLLINELGTGGAERIILYLIKYLPKIDPKINFYLFLLEKVDTTYPIPKNVKIIYGSKKEPPHIIKFLNLPLLAIKLKSVLKDYNINQALSFLNRANYVNIISKKLGSHHKCIISERNTASLVYDPKSLLGNINRYLIKKLYPGSDKIIAISGGVKTDLIENFNIPEEKVVVIYNPIDVNTIKSRSTEKIQHPWLDDESIKTIISVGRLEKQKNHALLIKAFRKVATRFPETRLLIIGEGGEREKLDQLITELMLEKYVELAGVHDNPFAYLSKADLFVLSSDFEGFGNVILEAMACHCPVISTDCRSGPNEIITNGKSGILVPVGDSDAMSDAIVSLLQNKPHSDSLAFNAQKRVLDFNVDIILKQFHQTLV